MAQLLKELAKQSHCCLLISKQLLSQCKKIFSVENWLNLSRKKKNACLHNTSKDITCKKNLFQSSEKIFLFKEKKWLNYSLWEKTKRKKDSSRKRNQKKRVDIFPFMRLYSTTCWTLLQWTRKRKGFTGVKSKQISRLSKSFQK